MTPDAQATITLNSGSSVFEVVEAVLFPFDDYSIPFRKDVLLNLIPGSRKPHDYREGASYDPDHPGEPVVQMGGDDDCDSMEIVMPSIVEVEGEYRHVVLRPGKQGSGSGIPVLGRRGADRSGAQTCLLHQQGWHSPGRNRSWDWWNTTATRKTILSTRRAATDGT